MSALTLKPEQQQRAYLVRFHVRVPARWHQDDLEKKRNWALERMIRRLAQQGWTFVRLSDRPPRGPLPVVPLKGFPKPPPRAKRKPGQASPPAPPDDALWRVSTLPTFGPKAPHLMTDEVEWEYAAIFSRAAITTEYVAPEKGEPEPLWLLRKH
ncbi:MAG TPA: hypothetical protein VFB50_17495 [Chloroflexota bacterium]|nr:hypothetical protein [Chloroflexota bacterium]